MRVPCPELRVDPQPWDEVLDRSVDAARRYLRSLPNRAVYRPTEPAEIRARIGGALPEDGEPAAEVVAALAEELDPFLAAHASGRYFGFVIGGLHPAALGAEVLASVWDQNAGLYGVTPGVAIVEEVAAAWLLDLLDLPRHASVGFVTGGQMATFTCLAAARDAVLRERGWDVEAQGLQGAPAIRVVVKSERHSTVPRALRYLGLGDHGAVEVASDAQARMDPGALRSTLERLDGPTIVCVEAGNVNTGAFDDFGAVADLAEEHRERGNPTWVHVDGAVGLLARACDPYRPLADHVERLDSWSTDAHKLLNVAYDSGIAITRHPAAHRAATSVHASYLVHADGDVRDPMDWNPEFSRRARGLGVYATLRSLGRRGVGTMIARMCGHAGRFASRLDDSGRAEVVNDVVFNQVLVRWLAPDGDHGALADRVVARIQANGSAFFSGTTWNGERLMRISVADHATDEADVDRAVDALLEAAARG